MYFSWLQTTINIVLSTMRHDEALFVNGGQFLPERWLRDRDNKYRTDPFTFLPFGFGARSCIGTTLLLGLKVVGMLL